MSTLEELESNARASRLRLAATWNAARGRLTPMALADEAVGLALPRLSRLETARAVARRHPFIASAGLAAIAFLLRRTFASADLPPRRAKRVRGRPT